MTKMVGQMMFMPFTVFAQSMEAFGRSMSGGGWMGECGKAVACPPCEPVKPAVCEAVAEVRRERAWECDDRCGEGLTCPPDWHDDGWRHHDHHEHHEQRNECCGRCGRRSCDCCCGSDRGSDTVKLVEYTLVTIRRGDASRILESGERLVSDCTDLEELRSEIIVDYVQRHCDKPIDGKHLRVYTKVLSCWCKQDVDWCEEQVDALQDIARSLRDQKAS
jgi:hypothetical protein